MAYGYRLLVYKKDGRTKTGERLVESHDYEGYSGHAMMDEIKYLKRHQYPQESGFRLDFVGLPD